MTLPFLPGRVKAALFHDLLELYPIVRVVAIGPGIVGPTHLLEPVWRSEETFDTDWGGDLAKPIPDMIATDDALSGTLLFGEHPCFVRIPWARVGAIVVYPLEPGPALVRLLSAVSLEDPPAKPVPALKVIPGGKDG